jgi:uncharacterized integral membrane protein
MQVLRTLGWVIITIILVAFVAINWTPVRVNFWPLEQGYLYFDWPIGFVALAFFLLGLLPMWLIHRAFRWRTAKRLAAMENSLRATSIPVAPTHATAPAQTTVASTAEPLPPV